MRELLFKHTVRTKLSVNTKSIPNYSVGALCKSHTSLAPCRYLAFLYDQLIPKNMTRPMQLLCLNPLDLQTNIF